MASIKVKGREELVPIFVPRKVAKVRARVIARSNSSLVLGGASTPRPVSFQWKNPDFLLKNADFLLWNPDFLLKNVDFIIKQGPKSPGGMTPRGGHGRSRQSSREVVVRVVPLQKMVGREQECELMRKIFMNVVTDTDAAVSLSHQRLCVLIEGEAGIGKSEICREAMHYAKGLGMSAFWTAGHADTISTPLRPFRCVLRGLFNEEQKHAKSSREYGGAGGGAAAGEVVSAQERKDRTISQLSAIFQECPEEDLRKHAGMFYSFVTSNPSEHAGDALHAPTLVKLIVHWLADLSKHSAILLVFDDAQWLDPTSWALCEALASSERCRGRVVMVFATRPFTKDSSLARRVSFLVTRASSNHLKLPPMTKPELLQIVAKRMETDKITKKSGGVFAPKSPGWPGPKSFDARMVRLEEIEVPKMDTNDAVKEYMRHFSESCVHIGGLGVGQEEDDEVTELFANFGAVYGASVRVRQQAHSSWALVSFASPAQVRFCIKNDGFCINNGGFCIKNDGFCRRRAS